MTEVLVRLSDSLEIELHVRVLQTFNVYIYVAEEVLYRGRPASR